ncbi:hypothetical protein Ndes2437B_g02087 [Nannochloris sp. 'desiccata']
MCSLLAIDLISKVTTASLVSGRLQEDLKSAIDGLEQLNILLYDTGTNVCLETSNLAVREGCTISLKELKSLAGVSGKHEGPQMTISSLHSARSTKESACLSSPQCNVTIPLLHSRPSEASSHFGSLVARVTCISSGRPSTKSIHGAVQLAETLSRNHAQQLREFVSLVISLLFRPWDNSGPPPPISTRSSPLSTHPRSTPAINYQQNEHQQQCTSIFFTALAPLASNGIQLPGPLPIVSLLTLEFQNSSLEAEFHSWKAECMRNQDVWSLFACFTAIIASVPAATPLSQLLQVGAIVVAAAAMALLATKMQSSSNSNSSLAFYRENRDKMLLTSSLCITAGVYLTGGGVILYNQIFALVAVLLPVRLRWHVAQLSLVLVWRIISTTSVLSAPLCLLRLFSGVVLAPFILAYVVECVARRGFLSRQALVAAAANGEARAQAEYDDDYEDEVDLYTDDEEDDEDFWLHEDGFADHDG